MKIKFLFVTIISFICASCQSYNSAVTPKARVGIDSFDGSKTISQKPVSSASKLTESWHTLGFDWTSKNPNKVYLTAGVQGINNVFDLDFNVGGKVITANKASSTTEYGSTSTRRFYVSYNDFKAIATAPIVKMKVSGANDYGVSSFGTSTKALVNTKFTPFLQQVQSLKN